MIELNLDSKGSKMNNIHKKGICLGCGNAIDSKMQFLSYCTDCLKEMKIDLSDIDKDEVYDELNNILKYFVSDVTAAFEKDPAAKSLIEVFTSYPGIQAVLIHRIAHFLWKIGLPFVPRFLSYIAAQHTGIEIHPGAKIGNNFFIDHGNGVVIGETSEIGNNVTLYQGVTLGGTRLEEKKRHPTLGNNIIIGAGAKILGPIHIGNNVRVGANSVVTFDIPDDCVVVGVPGRIISDDKDIREEIKDLNHGKLPDPVIHLIKDLEKRIGALEENIKNSRNSQNES